MAVVALLTGILSLLGGAKLLVDLVGFVYPAYMSFKSMDANNGEDTQWLTYWVVFAFFSIVEGMAGFLTRLIPFYYITKTGFILWLYHPQTSEYFVAHVLFFLVFRIRFSRIFFPKFSVGAQSIYAGVLRPYLLPYISGDGSGKKTE
jgi:TB2/DP1, HVA22 family